MGHQDHAAVPQGSRPPARRRCRHRIPGARAAGGAADSKSSTPAGCRGVRQRKPRLAQRSRRATASAGGRREEEAEKNRIRGDGGGGTSAAAQRARSWRPSPARHPEDRAGCVAGGIGAPNAAVRARRQQEHIQRNVLFLRRQQGRNSSLHRRAGAGTPDGAPTPATRRRLPTTLTASDRRSSGPSPRGPRIA